MKHLSFEDYLYSEVHPRTYIGLDDDMPDDYEKWLSDLSVDELLEYGDEYRAWYVGNLEKLLQ